MNWAALSMVRNNQSPLRLHLPEGVERNTAYWRINGYPARVICWTAAEWERLAERPIDAQYLPCGVWCVLRVDER